MGWVDDSHVCYCDTDSDILLYDETNPKHKKPFNYETPEGLNIGTGLGCWEDELKGAYIEELVVA
eukprot:12813809-Prorocentrum_lima.AAC.1